jgi:hypothetical protein
MLFKTPQGLLVRADRVKRWHTSKQRARWFALGLLEAENDCIGLTAARGFQSSRVPSNVNLISTKIARRSLFSGSKTN